MIILFLIIALFVVAPTTTTEATVHEAMILETDGDLITVQIEDQIYTYYGDDVVVGETINLYLTNDGEIVYASKEGA